MSRQRASTFFVTVGFVVTVIIYYSNYLVPVWGYQGFNEFNSERSSISLAFAVIYVLVFALIYPSKIICYSRFVVWILFYFLYLPSVLIVAMSGVPDDGGLALVTCITISLLLIAVIPEYTISSRSAFIHSTVNPVSLLSASRGRNEKFRSPYDVPLIIFSSFILLVVFVYFFEIIEFVSLLNVYEQRKVASNYSPNRALMSYVSQWSVRVISPFLIAVGLIYKNKVALIIGLFGFLLSFLISGGKFTLFVVLLMFFLYRFVLVKRAFSGLQIGVFFWAALGIPYIVAQVLHYGDEHVIGLLLSQVLKRAYAVGGMTLGNYFDFFSSSPYTYYSHIGPIGWFVDYPYEDLSIGQIVGHFQAGTFEYNMTANFWSTDGVAAAGYAGIILIGFVLGLILALFNLWTKPRYFILLCLSSVGSIWMLADTSVFRVLLTGGWPLHFLLAYLYSSRLVSAK